MRELPPGWAIATISDVTEYLSRGKQPKYADHSSLPVVNQRAIQWSGIQDEYLKYVDPTQFDRWESERFIQPGDILWNSTGRGTVGRACLVTQRDVEPPKVVDSHVTILRPNQQAINPYFLFFWIRSSEIQDLIESLATGATNQIELGRKVIASVSIPVAPIDEQKRIVSKLDYLLMRLEKCRDRLGRAKDMLERFRQTVIATYISGQLAQDWQNSENVKVSSQEVVGKLADFADVIDPNPSHRYPSYVGGTVPLLSTEQMANLNDWDISSAKLAIPEFYEARKAAHNFLDDDVIFARKGRLGLARNPPSNTDYVFSHSVFIIRNKSDKLLSSYLLWFLRQEWCVKWLSLEMNSNAGVPTLGKSVMQSLPIRIPERSEQHEAVRYIENFFDYADQIESHYQNALDLVNHLKGTILSKAFRGELVVQDADAEPASDLLERIQTERTNKPKRSLSYRKPKMPKVNEEYIKKVISQLPRDVFLFDELRAKLTCDYDKLKDILFALLDESEPSISQVFDQETKLMQFVRRDK